MTRATRLPRMTRRDALGLLAVGAASGVAAGWPAAQATSAAQRGAAAAPISFPTGSVIRTVLRDVPAETLTKPTLFHEHLSFEWSKVAPQRTDPGPAKDATPILEQLVVAEQEGLGCLVDAGTTDVGRDTAFLRQIAARTGVHIVACGGLYMERTYTADVLAKSDDAIADDLALDARTSRYGAFGEIGEMPNAAMSTAERKVFRAVGKAHLRTRLPVFTHNAYGTGPNVPRDAGLQQLDAFESVGVNPSRVAIGHSCCLDDPSAGVIIELAKRGAYVGFDRVTGGLVPDDKKVAMILRFLEAGHEERLLLSSDYNFTARSAARPGYATTLTVFLPKLRAAGVGDATLRRITVDNPRQFLSFVPPAA